MIYPASYNITLLQNSSWKALIRVTEPRKDIQSMATSSGITLFASECHKLAAGDKVVFTGEPVNDQSELKEPCGLDLNVVYYVLNSGLTDNAFAVGATSSGSPIAITTPGSGLFYAAKPISLTGYTVDADVRGLQDDQEVATFAGSLNDAENGEVLLTMSPAITSGIEIGSYGWDVSLTSGSGERYYWLQGVATVARTYSR